MSSLLTFPQPDHSTFERAKEYFRGRPNYTFQGNQIDFDNEETGCGFTIELDQPNLAICFVLNYNRPKPFIREGIAEVSEFNKAFPGKFLNEETDNLEDFDARCYLANWSRVNDNFVRDHVAGHDGFGQAFTTSLLIENAWAWNAMRAAQMNASEEDIFFAKIMWLRTVASNAVPFSIWPETVPTVFPAFVERVAIGTSEPIQSGSQQRPVENRNILRFVTIETLLANVEFDRRSVNGIPAYAVGAEFSPGLRQAMRLVSPGVPAEECFVHSALVLESDILSDMDRSYSS